MSTEPTRADAPLHPGADEAAITAPTLLRLIREAIRIQRAGLKSYGLLVASPAEPGFPFLASDVVFLDQTHNRRNDAANRAAFHAQGAYFRDHDDAGFVADPTDVLNAFRRIEERGFEVVAAFHSHRRQPANFSSIDFRLHDPTVPWHLILSFRNRDVPELQPFRVTKDLDCGFGISADDCLEGSEQTYDGPEVAPLNLVVTGDAIEVGACAGLLGQARTGWPGVLTATSVDAWR